MAEVPTLWQPLNGEYIIDPYPMYEKLRKEDAIHKSQTGEWIVTRYEDVKRILSDKSFYAGNRLNWFKNVANYADSKGDRIEHIPESIKSFLLFKNPPEHKTWRGAISSIWPSEKSFSNIINQNIERLLPARIQNLDFVSEFARPLAASVIGSVLGLNDTESKEISSDN